MGNIRRSRHARQEVGAITNEWVELNCARVTDRDKEMLKLLKKYHVMSSKHLYMLTPGAGGYAPFWAGSKGQQRCNDRIRILYDLHCVNKFSPLLPPGAGTSVQYVWLDRAGAKLLGAQSFRRRTTIPMDYLHTAAILDLYCELLALERQQLIEIKYIDIEQQNKTWLLIPDMLFIIRTKGKGYISLIEVDRCEKKEKDELEKIRSYADWKLSNQWLKEDWAQVMPQPRFPRVIYLFDESKPRWKARAKRFQDEADKYNLKFTASGLSRFVEMIKALADG